MRAFWDEKARENATYYVSSYRPYDRQDPEEFWKWGEILTQRFLNEAQFDFSGREEMLEIGCGIGRMTRCFARRFAVVHAIDVSQEMIAQAGENLAAFANVQLHLGNGRDLSAFADGRFDFVFSYITFQHIPKAAITARYIAEAGRVLKPGGGFYFQVNNAPLGLRARLRLGSRIRPLLRTIMPRRDPQTSGTAPRGLDHPAWRGSRMSLAEIRRACAAGHLDIVALQGEGTQYLWVKAIRI
ncbi:MAG: class I SAM-dependent methyltransferase [Candidatus Eisenbacteria bacterium]